MNVIAVDVGTTSVRLALIEFSGSSYNETHVVASREKAISRHQDGARFEQSTREIWAAVCECCSTCISESKIRPDSIRSIAFSATCSLVILDDSLDYPRDIIMWMDHRSIVEANEVTQSKSKVLEQFGGVCSPEFSLAKLLWLQKHQPKRLSSAKALFELPDWLVYQCIRGDPVECPRSLCSLTCKWGYDAVSDKHCDLIKAFEPELEHKLGLKVLKPGTMAGCLSLMAARELGLVANEQGEGNGANELDITVATSLIDAHSGTSSCHMLLSKERKFVHGIWGPYTDVVLNGYNLLEAGQSLTGKLIDMCIETSQEGRELLASGVSSREIIKKLNASLDAERSQNSLNILPTFHGSRSPLANPRLKGGVYGLTAEGPASLLELYVATVEAIVFETKSIVEVLEIELDAILVSGGLMKNTFYMQTLADVLGCKAVKMSLEDIDFMVMGSGLTARCAALTLDDDSGDPLSAEMVANIEYGQLAVEIYEPNESRNSYLSQKYACYKEFVEFSQRVDRIMHPKID